MFSSWSGSFRQLIAKVLIPSILGCLLLALFCAGDRGISESRAGQQPIPADPLLTLNDAFREAYARTRQKLIDKSGPIILVEGDNLVLLRDGKRTEARVIPDLFHTLKAVSHVPLAIYVMLMPLAEAPLNKECLDALVTYRERVVQAEKTLKQRGLTEPVLQREQEIIRASLVFLDTVLQKKQITKDELDKFTREQGPALLANAADAAQAELEAMDKQVKAWRALLSAEEWKKLHLIVMGSALPRKGNLAVQYFGLLLNEKGEGSRIVYAESLFEENRALNLLGTHLIDTKIGFAFFNDPQRMHRDLLSDAATEYLKKNPPQP